MLKKLLLSTLAILTASCCNYFPPTPPHIEHGVRFICKINEHFKQKYHFSVVALGALGDCVARISLIYSLDGKLYSIDEARQLIVSCLDEITTEVNNDEKIRPYLKEYPFPMTRIRLEIIFPKAKYGNPDAHGKLAEVTCIEGKILYKTDLDCGSEILHEESYETAKEILSCKQ